MSRITRRDFIKTTTLAAASTTLAPRLATAQPKEVLLAAVVALTGPNAAWGQRTWNAFQLGCDMVNEQGGIKSMGGAKLKYVVADTESKPEVAGSQTEKVIQRGCIAITGTNQSAATIVATQIAEREGVPFVCATDVDPLITSRGFKYTFRTSPIVESYARDLLAYIKDLSQASGKPAKKLAILSENSIVGQSSVEGTRRVAKDLGYDMVDADTDLCTTSWSGDVDILGLKDLAKKYNDRFKEAMDSTSAGGFTAFSVLWDSLERAGSADRKKLRDTIAATSLKTGEKMYMQLRGAKFVASGENSMAGGLVFTIKSKEWVTVAPKEYAKTTAAWPKPKWGV